MTTATAISHRTIQTNGINMHIAEAGEGPLVLLLHGFPELWYSWRHQLPALAAAGYHAVAPDVRGYGGTDAPQPIEAYSMKNMVADAVGVLDALGEQTAVVAGHDWGAPMAWNCAITYADRFRAVIGMSVPFLPRGPIPPMQLFRQVFANQFFYILYFQDPGVAEKELEADVRKSMRTFLYSASGDVPPPEANFWQKPKDSTFLFRLPDPGHNLPSWLTEDDLDEFVGEFERTGYRGGLNRYRNMDRDWEDSAELAGAKVRQPAMFITGERDGVRSFTPPPEQMREHVPDLREIIVVPGAGHWIQQERPAEVNEAMLKFLGSM